MLIILLKANAKNLNWFNKIKRIQLNHSRSLQSFQCRYAPNKFIRSSKFKSPKTIILIYDTDEINNLQILNANLLTLKKTKAKIINLHSALNFEDEIIKATNVTSIHSVFKTSSLDKFKNKFIVCKDLKHKLNSTNFVGN